MSTRGSGAGLTRRGAVLLVSGVLVYAVGEYLGYPLLRVVGGAAVAVVLAGLLATARPVRLKVGRELHPDRVERGSAALVRLTVHNLARTRFPGADAHDLLVHSRGARDEVRLRLPAVGRGAEQVARYTVPTGRRGRLDVGGLVVDRGDLLGLARRQLTVGEPRMLRVYPKTWPARVVTGGTPRHHHEGPVPAAQLAGSIELRSIREYVPGDPRRALHWRASARTGRLMVRDFVDPSLPRFAVLLDTSGRGLDAERFEEAVDTAASLLVSAANHDIATSLYTTAGKAVEGSGGLAGAREVLDALCDVEQQTGVPSKAPADDGWRRRILEVVRPGGYLVVVAGRESVVDDELLAALTRRTSTLVRVGIGSGDSPDDRHGVRQIFADTAREAVDAWNAAVLA